MIILTNNRSHLGHCDVSIIQELEDEGQVIVQDPAQEDDGVLLQSLGGEYLLQDLATTADHEPVGPGLPEVLRDKGEVSEQLRPVNQSEINIASVNQSEATCRHP